ncbi:MAG: hypothetical protein KGJ59_09540 [Bacteroidota bacterium]|nr:hypothetical protein [Bacteroidota bacterium]
MAIEKDLCVKKIYQNALRQAMNESKFPAGIMDDEEPPIGATSLITG